MNTAILVTPKDKSEFNFISEFFKKTKIKSKVLSIEELEDFGLGLLMQEADRNDKANKEAVLKK
ncbi:MAG: hypothetical protein EPN82_17020 [Bacteroidetes bacterium]|nr:MAG: hypothetical protein EPN82_17020 [Bacteroidota bacterium]